MVSLRGSAPGALLAIVLTLGLAACGGDDNGEDGDRGGGDAAEFDGSWTGTTSQDMNLSFTVQAGAVTQLSVPYEYGGDDCRFVGTRLGGTLKNPVSVTDSGFRVEAFGGMDVFEGTFESSTAASGKGHFEPQAQYRPGCETADITWQASR